MSKISTSPEVSARHAFIFEKELREATSEKQLAEASARHSRFLTGKDVAHLQAIYVEQLGRFRRHK